MMHARQLATGESRQYVVVLEAGDEAMRELTRFAEEASLDGASLTAIGAFGSATIGWFDPDAQAYRRTEVRSQAEVVSLVGDITLADLDSGEPKVHAHVVLGMPDGRALGGHLLAGHVRPTLEVMVTETPSTLRRRFDPRTGLALIDPSIPPGGPGDPEPGGTDGENRR